MRNHMETEAFQKKNGYFLELYYLVRRDFLLGWSAYLMMFFFLIGLYWLFWRVFHNTSNSYIPLDLQAKVFSVSTLFFLVFFYTVFLAYSLGRYLTPYKSENYLAQSFLIPVRFSSRVSFVFFMAFGLLPVVSFGVVSLMEYVFYRFYFFGVVGYDFLPFSLWKTVTGDHFLQGVHFLPLFFAFLLYAMLFFSRRVFLKFAFLCVVFNLLKIYIWGSIDTRYVSPRVFKWLGNIRWEVDSVLFVLMCVAFVYTFKYAGVEFWKQSLSEKLWNPGGIMAVGVLLFCLFFP